MYNFFKHVLIRFFSLRSDFDLQGEADKLTQKIAAVLFSFFLFVFFLESLGTEVSCFDVATLNHNHIYNCYIMTVLNFSESVCVLFVCKKPSALDFLGRKNCDLYSSDNNLSIDYSYGK